MAQKKKFRLKLLFQEFDLSAGIFTIGRYPWCNITLDDPLVSREHVRITIDEERAVLDDLGSRNGTLVNGLPVFNNYVLKHFDRIRIGAHELVFLEQTHYPSTQLRPTGTMMACPECRIPCPNNVTICPHCGCAMVPDKICRKCRTPAAEDEPFCPKCGEKFERQDHTVPVELGGDASGWTTQLVDEVIEKALTVGRYEQAAKLIDGKISSFDQAAKNGTVNVHTLIDITRLTLTVAHGQKDARRMGVIMDRWCRHQAEMPNNLLSKLEEAAHGWYDIRGDLKRYISALNSRSESRMIDPELKEQLARLTREAPGK